MVAIEVVPDTHGDEEFGVPLPVKIIVAFLHTDVVPEIVGFALTVNDAVLVQPFTSV